MRSVTGVTMAEKRHARRRRWGPCSAVLGILLALAGPACDQGSSNPAARAGPAEGPPCTCDAARLINGWCEACRAGYVGGRHIGSFVLFEALDAHGHEVNPQTMECSSCRAALAAGGFCETCRHGFVDGQLYFSRLSYHLARGTPVNPSSLDCDLCRANATSFGWCEACERGMIGNVIAATREDYDRGSREFQRLLRAIDTSARCETCALAIMFDGLCPQCGIRYAGGEAVEGPAATESRR